MTRLLAALAAAVSVAAQPYAQKFRSFYSIDDPAAPAVLRVDPPRPPVGEFAAVASSSDGAVWMGGPSGLVRYDPKAPDVRDRYQYFAGRRYLPDDDVRAIAPDAAGGVWVRTATGVSHIELRRMTLEEKAAAFEQIAQTRHDRYGMVAPSRLDEPGNLASNRTVSSDNDGLWTAMYGAAECFRYAVTKSPEALARARRATDAVLFLEQITGKSGFPARSYVKKGEERPSDGVWHWTEDGQYQWKGDTSSDEIVGHFYLYSIAFDLLPDPALKQRIAGATRRIMDHIVENGWRLIDVTGKPTLWGKWSPEYFESKEGRPDAPLNAVELLSFLKTAQHITGDPEYGALYDRVAREMRYADMAQRYLERREEINYSDEELAMLAFYPLMRYEKNADLLAAYRRAMDQWMQNIRREDNPLWTFIYIASNPGAAANAAGAVRTLYRVPMDVVTWHVANSGRRDVQWQDAADRFHRRQALTLLPMDERPVMKWNGNPFVVDGGDGGRSEEDGTFFLLPFWMGRYMGLIPQGGGTPKLAARKP